MFPADFDLSSVQHSERRVIEAFVKELDDAWYVIPSIPIVMNHKDAEIDLVLLSHDQGMYVVEVKGGIITVTDGQWKSYDRKIKNPAEQASKAKYALLNRLRAMKVTLDGVFVQHIVAFPDIVDFPAAGAGPDTPREIVFTGAELSSPAPYLARLRKDNAVASDQTIASVLNALKPNITDIQVTGGFITGATQRISKASVDELRLLFDLDENKRIILRGSAGTGKTFLAHHWARRALLRGDRTLLMCFNRALGNDLYEGLVNFAAEHDASDRLRVGSYHATMNALLGDFKPVVPDNADKEFWDNAHADALLANHQSIDIAFDTIIIDEGQDFRENWFTALESLLSDRLTSRFYVTLDEDQDLFASPAGLPENATLFRLHHNVRSTRQIAEFGQRLGGAAIRSTSPLGLGVQTHVVRGARERKKKVGDALRTIVNELHIPLSQILVLAPHNDDVADLTKEPIDGFTLVPWNQRSEESVACATIHSTKGLERLAVILTSLDDDVDRKVAYVGLTRASVFMSIIGTEKFLATATNADLARESSRSASELTADPTDHIRDVERIAPQP